MPSAAMFTAKLPVDMRSNVILSVRGRTNKNRSKRGLKLPLLNLMGFGCNGSEDRKLFVVNLNGETCVFQEIESGLHGMDDGRKKCSGHGKEND